MVAINPIGWGFLGLAAISAGFLVFSLVRLARAHAPLPDAASAPAAANEPAVNDAAPEPASAPAADAEARNEAMADERADEER